MGMVLEIVILCKFKSMFRRFLTFVTSIPKLVECICDTRMIIL